MLFEQKKIQIETLSEYLSAARKNLNFSISEVSKKTGIKTSFIENLESGNFKRLPADVYVLGFLKQLAELYLIGPKELANQYKKEKGIQKHLEHESGTAGARWGKKYFKKIVITPKLLSIFFILTFITMSLLYIIWQVWSINKAPSLQIMEPENNSVIAGSAVNVQGVTDPGIIITVNDQVIFVDQKGNFQTQLGLTPGAKEITILAKNRFGKTVSKLLRITGASQLPEDSKQLNLKIDFSATVVLSLTIDDGIQQTLQFAAGDSKTFTAKQKIVLSTSDAGATKVNLNGQNIGSLGKPHEQLNNLPFYSKAAESPSN